MVGEIFKQTHGNHSRGTSKPAGRRRHQIHSGPVRGHSRVGKGQDVSRRELDTLIDEGAGFAGAALWGNGPGTAFPRHAGANRHGLVHAADLAAGHRAVCLRSLRRRKAASVLPSPEPQARPEDRRGQGLSIQRRNRARAFPCCEECRRDDCPVGPRGRRYPRQAMLRLQGAGAGAGYLQEITTSCNALGWGVYQADHEDGNGQYEVGELQLQRCADDGRSLHILQDDDLADRAEVRRNRDAHGEAVQRSHGAAGRTFTTTSRVSRTAKMFSSTNPIPTASGWRRPRIISSAAY